MGRKKGSLNKKNKPVQLEFEEKKSFDEKTEVCMPTEVKDEVEIKNEVQGSPISIDNMPEMFERNVEIDEVNAELEQIQQELDLARMELEKTRLEVEVKKKELITMPAVAKASETPAIVNKDHSLSEKIAEKKARDKVMVTGKFYNLRVKGQSVKLPYSKYGDEPVKWWPFDHGKVYTIPKGFADQINGGTETDPHYYTPHFIKNEGIITDPDDPESGIHAVDSSDKKFSFVPLNF